MIVVPGRVIRANCVLNCLNPGIKFFLRSFSVKMRNLVFALSSEPRLVNCKTLQYLLRAQHCSIVASSFNHS